MFIYHGDASQIPSTPEEAAKAMQAWGAWMGGLGDALVDPGDPVGKSMSVTPDGVIEGAKDPAYGYSIVEASDLAAACEMAKGNPMVVGSGSVEVAEITPIQM